MRPSSCARSNIARVGRSPVSKIPWRMGYITTEDLLRNAARFDKNGYGAYLRNVAAEGQ